MRHSKAVENYWYAHINIPSCNHRDIFDRKRKAATSASRYICQNVKSCALVYVCYPVYISVAVTFS